VNKLLEFSHHYTFIKRKLAVQIFHKISEDADIFTKYCAELFQKLCHDPVPNIRYCCAKVVAAECHAKTSVTVFKRMLLKLRRDEDVDVRIAAGQHDRQTSKLAIKLTPPLRGMDVNPLLYDEIFDFSDAETSVSISNMEEEMEIDIDGSLVTIKD
jgi:hypothetical protein